MWTEAGVEEDSVDLREERCEDAVSSQEQLFEELLLIRLCWLDESGTWCCKVWTLFLLDQQTGFLRGLRRLGSVGWNRRGNIMPKKGYGVTNNKKYRA